MATRSPESSEQRKRPFIDQPVGPGTLIADRLAQLPIGIDRAKARLALETAVDNALTEGRLPAWLHRQDGRSRFPPRYHLVPTAFLSTRVRSPEDDQANDGRSR